LRSRLYPPEVAEKRPQTSHKRNLMPQMFPPAPTLLLAMDAI